MIYEMKLRALPYGLIASGSKTVELRLFDEKRRRIDVGDYIVFANLENPTEKMAVLVHSLHRYSSFEDLFRDISPEKCGYNSTDTAETAVAGMKEYYTDEQIRKHGVLGIDIILTDTNKVLNQLKEQKEAEFERLFPDGMK